MFNVYNTGGLLKYKGTFNSSPEWGFGQNQKKAAELNNMYMDCFVGQKIIYYFVQPVLCHTTLSYCIDKKITPLFPVTVLQVSLMLALYVM